MRLLLLGGPKFLGRAIIDAALDAGHELTLFNRGTTNVDHYPDVERLTGDRDGALDALRGRSWDAVVDTCGYLPRLVRDSAQVLADTVSQYLFVSSISVYASHAAGATEESPVDQLTEPGSEDVKAHYGALKALCEQEVETALPGRATHVRAGLIVGPHDPTGRFTYWPHRVARGGEILVPGPLERPVQTIDVRDLGAWIVHCAEQRVTGVFNATSRPYPLAELLHACVLAAEADPDFTVVDDAFLVDSGVDEWMELPLWIDTRQEAWRHFLEADVERAHAAGLEPRPLIETVQSTLEEAELVDGIGLDPAKERELIAAFRSRASAPTP